MSCPAAPTVRPIRKRSSAATLLGEVSYQTEAVDLIADAYDRPLQELDLCVDSRTLSFICTLTSHPYQDIDSDLIVVHFTHLPMPNRNGSTSIFSQKPSIRKGAASSVKTKAL